MAFTGNRDTIAPIGAGELMGGGNIVYTYTTFEDGQKAGRFARFDQVTKGIKNIDGSADPILAGVTLRSVVNPIEDGGAYTAENSVSVDVCEDRLITIDTVPGATINKLDAVYAYNGATVDDQGKATNDATDGVLADAVFYEQEDTDVWTVRLK